MIIDVTDPATIPFEIGKLVIDTFNMLPEYIVSDITSNSIEYQSDVSSAVEKYLGTWKNYTLCEQLIALLEQHGIICYHSTKMIDKNLVREHGLKASEWESYKANMERVFYELSYSQTQLAEALDIIKQEYVRKYEEKGRKPQLCFFTNLSMIDKETTGYEQFCENIGGELARRALKQKHSGLYEPLYKNGEAFIVKFVMPFRNIAYYRKDSIAHQFIIYYVGKHFWNKEFDIEFDGNTESDVPKKNIIDILPYAREIYY